MPNIKSQTNKSPRIAPSQESSHSMTEMLSSEQVQRTAGMENGEGDTWEETDEVVKIEVKKPLKMVIPVRFSADKWEELHKVARELGIGPTTLARMWILERLRLRVRTGV